jgi:hypothetical protein
MEFENRGAGARLWEIGKLEVVLLKTALQRFIVVVFISFISGLSHVQVTRWRFTVSSHIEQGPRIDGEAPSKLIMTTPRKSLEGHPSPE